MKTILPGNIAFSVRTCFLISLVFLLNNHRSQATVRTVCASGCNFTTIAAAMSAAVSGDTIQLNVTGIFTEKDIIVPEKDLTLIGLGKTTTILQAAATRASASGGRIFKRTTPTGATSNYFIVEDMTLRNAYAPFDPTLCCGQLLAAGGVLYAYGGLKGMVTKFNRCKFYANETTPGNTNNSGGACIYISATGSTSPYNAYLELNDCDFDDNKCGTSAGSSLTDGPVLYLAGSPNSCKINNCTFTNNNGYTRGGVIYAAANWTIDTKNSTFANNTCRNGDGGCFGARSGTWTFENCAFKNNSAVFVSSVNGNQGHGGVFHGGNGRFKNCTFYNNSAVAGGAILRTNNGTAQEMHLVNCTFYGNTASSKGKTIYYGSFPPSTTTSSFPLVMVNTIIVNGGGAAANEVHFNMAYNNLAVNTKNYCTSVANDASSPGTTPVFDFNAGNTTLGLSSTMALNGGTTENLSLDASSTLINAGTHTPGSTYSISTKDQRNYSRHDLGIDIGAYEYNGITDNADNPAVAYSPLPNNPSTANRTLNGVSVSDANGTFWFGSLLPKIYYKKGIGGTWFSSAGTLASGSGINGNWNFTIDNSLMGGVINGDRIYYYVVGQDVSTVSKITSSPAGVVATDVNTIISAPATPASYLVGSTLPVSLLSFTANPVQTDVLLDWKTADAINFSHFELERSIDGSSFSVLNRQPVKPGNGEMQYNYSDINALNTINNSGRSFYRLKMVDLDGRYTYSQVVKVQFGKEKSFLVNSIQPNPFIDKITISFFAPTKSEVTVILTGISGGMIKNKKLSVDKGYSVHTLDNLDKLSKGMYILQVQKGEETVTQQIIKQ